MELIDKAAVVAEIERMFNEVKGSTYESDEGVFYAMKHLRSFINTLEVKSVNLKNKVCKWLNDNCDDAGYFNQLEFAKYFFELGLKNIERKPNGGIVLEDFNEGEGFYKVNLAYLNREQVIEIEELVKKLVCTF